MDVASLVVNSPLPQLPNNASHEKEKAKQVEDIETNASFPPLLPSSPTIPVMPTFQIYHPGRLSTNVQLSTVVLQQCKYCNKSFVTPERLNEHMHHDEPSPPLLIITMGGRISTYTSSLYEHLLIFLLTQCKKIGRAIAVHRFMLKLSS